MQRSSVIGKQEAENTSVPSRPSWFTFSIKCCVTAEWISGRERASVCEAIRECISVRAWTPISCPCECDPRAVFLTRSVRAERRCCKPACVWLHALAAAGLFRCLYLLHYSWGPNERKDRHACIYLAFYHLWHLICVFGVTEWRTCGELWLCVYISSWTRTGLEEGDLGCCDVRQVVCVEWQTGAERLPE